MNAAAVLAAASGLETHHRLVLFVLLASPLGLAFRQLRDVQSRHLFNVIVGFAMALLTYGPLVSHSFISALVSYAMLLIVPRRHVGVAVTLWMFGYMVVVHANRFLYEVPQPWDGSQMVLTLKLSALALNFADGRLAATERPPHLKRTVHLAVRETPSLLEYFGYVYCFLCFHAGPMIEFRDYMRFMASSAVEERELTHLAAANVRKAAGALPAAPAAAAQSVAAAVDADEDDLRPLAQRLLRVVDDTSGGVGASKAEHATTALRSAAEQLGEAQRLRDSGVRFPTNRVHLHNAAAVAASIAGFLIGTRFPLSFVGSAPFHALPWPQRVAYTLVSISLFRYKYHVVWGLVGLASGVAGVGYLPRKRDWDALRNCDMLLCEVPVNMRTAINEWNRGVQHWIGTYVYSRVALRHGKPTVVSQALSFFLSALWHGLHPGYYLFFLTGVLYISLSREIRRRIRPRLVPDHGSERDRAAHPLAFLRSPCGQGPEAPAPPSPLWVAAWLYHAAATAGTWVLLNYAGVAFTLLRAGPSFRVWTSLGFFGHVLAAAALALVRLVPAPRQQASLKKE